MAIVTEISMPVIAQALDAENLGYETDVDGVIHFTIRRRKGKDIEPTYSDLAQPRAHSHCVAA
jgi:isopentenyl phosphate kinase